MKRGLSLVEVLIYVAVFTLLATVVVMSLLGIGRVLRHARLLRTVALEGDVATGLLVRQTRLAESVETAASTFDVHPGALELNTVLSSATTTPVTRRFYLSEGKLFMDVSTSTTMTFLLTPHTTVTNFVVSNPTIASGISEAVRIEVTLEAIDGKQTVTRNFSGGAVLRGSYEE